MEDLTITFAPRTMAAYLPVLGIPKKDFSEAIMDETLSGRIIISGDSGCGKTTLALLIAAGINCTDPDVRPCGKCENCENVFGPAWDVRLIDSVSMSVQHFRDMREELAQMPFLMKKRVIILDEAQRLTADSQQQLLKIMDTFPSTCFIFCTTDPQKINKAIMTRCSKFNVSPLSDKLSKLYIKEVCLKLDVPIDDHEIEAISRESNGVPRTILINIQNFIAGTFKESEAVEDENKSLFLKTIRSGDYSKINKLMKESTLPADEIRRTILSGCLGGLNKGDDSYGEIAKLFLPAIVFDAPKTDILIRSWEACKLFRK